MRVVAIIAGARKLPSTGCGNCRAERYSDGATLCTNQRDFGLDNLGLRSLIWRLEGLDGFWEVWYAMVMVYLERYLCLMLLTVEEHQGC